jgi:hypothetical protein
MRTRHLGPPSQSFLIFDFVMHGGHQRTWQFDKSRFRNTLAARPSRSMSIWTGTSRFVGDHTRWAGRCPRKIVAAVGEEEAGHVKKFACGGKESESPPFPFPPSGGKPGAPPPPLRYGSGNPPAQNEHSSAPLTPRPAYGLFCSMLQSGQTIKPDILTCWQHMRAVAHASRSLRA